MWAADRFNPFFSRSAAGRRYKGGLAEERAQAISKNFSSLSVDFCYFQSIRAH